MAHALGVSRSDLLLRRLRDEPPEGFAALVERRMAHEPVAYIVGRQEFYGLDLAVSPAVLVPRADSETLVEAARLAFAGRPPQRLIDLGTGSGALLLAAASLWPGAQAVGIDRSGEALALASANARALGFAAQFEERDWTQGGWAAGLGRFDLILANPPYVEDDAELAPQVRGHEPAGALFAGADGLADYRVLVPQLPALLAPDGVAVVEIGHTQAEAVAGIGQAAGLASRLHRDLGGRPRALEFMQMGEIPLGNPGREH
jgi:release factor glutamine methyltransferase